MKVAPQKGWLLFASLLRPSEQANSRVRSCQDHRLSGMLSADASANPVFHNWTLVYVPYCDGASFTGDSEVDGLHFKGQQLLG